MGACSVSFVSQYTLFNNKVLNGCFGVYGRAKNWQKVAYLRRNPSPSVKWKTIA